MEESNDIKNSDIKSFIDKLLFLESKIGYKNTCSFLEPFNFEPMNTISLQSAAKTIADFIGLSNFTFVIGKTKQTKNTAGHIDLDNEKFVFIEIEPKQFLFPNAVLSILSHELTHKYMQVNGLYKKNIDLDEEIFTDITAIYLGLGKLMVNGARIETLDGSQKTVHTIGYISRMKMLFVYRLVCSMRKTHRGDFEKGLNWDGIQKLKYLESSFPEYLNEDFYTNEKKKELRKFYMKKIRDTQTELSMINKYNLYVEKLFLNSTENFLKSAHSDLNQSLIESQLLAQTNQLNPHYDFLNTINCFWKANSNFSEINQESKKYSQCYRNILKTIQSSDLTDNPESELFRVVSCWKCGTLMRLPKDNKYVVAICPKCNYEFVVDTTIEGLIKRGFLSKIFKD